MDDELTQLCERVLRPVPDSAARSRPASRWRSLLKTAGILAFPWKDNWTLLATYAGQHCSRGNSSHSRSFSTRLLTRLLAAEMYLAGYWFSPAPMLTLYLQNAARRLPPETMEFISRENFDFLWFEHSFCHPIARALISTNQRTQLICDAHNVESELHRRYMSLANTSDEARWLGLQARLIERVESDAFQFCSLTLACSKNDASLITQLAPSANVLTVPNGVDTKYFQPARVSLAASKPTLLVTASFT